MAKIDFETAQLILSDVPEDKKFFCSNGNVIANLEELIKELRKMDKEVFANHVTPQKNDFATWIYDVIGDVKLTDNISEVKDPKAMAKKIRTRITYIKKNMDKSSC